MAEAEQQQEHRQERDLRDGIEERHQRIEEMAYPGHDPGAEPDDDAGHGAEREAGRDAVEARGKRDEELAGDGELPQRGEDRARPGQVARQHARAAENFPGHQRRKRQYPVLERCRADLHASSSARALSTSSRSRSHTLTRKAMYSADLR